MLKLIDNCQNKVSADQYLVTILRVQVKNSSTMCVFFFYLVVDWIAGSAQVITVGEREGVHAKAKFWHKLNADALLTFLPTYSLHNRLLECP